MRSRSCDFVTNMAEKKAQFKSGESFLPRIPPFSSYFGSSDIIYLTLHCIYLSLDINRTAELHHINGINDVIVWSMRYLIRREESDELSCYDYSNLIDALYV